MTFTVNCIAVIGRQNNPLYLRSFHTAPRAAPAGGAQQPEQSFADDLDLKYHYIAHTSLDMIEEKGAGRSLQSVRN